MCRRPAPHGLPHDRGEDEARRIRRGKERSVLERLVADRGERLRVTWT